MAAEEAEELALELGVMLTGADIVHLLHEDPAILERVRRAVRSRLAVPGESAKAQKENV